MIVKTISPVKRQDKKVEYQVVVLCIPFANWEVICLCRLKMESEMYQKIDDFSGNIEISS